MVRYGSLLLLGSSTFLSGSYVGALDLLGTSSLEGRGRLARLFEVTCVE
jgi:hypothetical protein